MPSIEIIEEQQHTAAMSHQQQQPSILRNSDGSPSRKRTAIDPNVINSRTYQPDVTQQEETTAPLQAAITYLNGITATLQQSLQSTVNRVGGSFCRAYAKYQKQKLTRDSLIESTDDNNAGKVRPARIPKSCNIKFSLKASNQQMEEDPEFQQLKQESDRLVEEFKQNQAKLIIKKQEMDIKYSKASMLEALAQGLKTITEAHKVTVEEPTTNTHMIVNTVLQTNQQGLLQPLDTTLQEFRALYMKAHKLQDLPPPHAPQAQQQGLLQQPQPPPQPRAMDPPPTAPAEPPLQGPYTMAQALQWLPNSQPTQVHLARLMRDGHMSPEEARQRALTEMAENKQRIRTYKMELANHQMDMQAYREEEATHQQALAEYTQAQQQYQAQLHAYNQQQEQLQQAPTQSPIKDFAKLEKLLMDVFQTPISQYQKQHSSNQKIHALKKLEKETFTTKATEVTAMEIDQEPPADRQTLLALIDQQVAAGIKSKLKEISKSAGNQAGKRVTQALNEQHNRRNNTNHQQSKDNRRGQTQGGASRNKKKSPNRRRPNQQQPRGRSASANRGARRNNNSSQNNRRNNNQTAGGRGRGRGRGNAGGRGHASSGGRPRNNTRGRSRTSSPSRQQNSSTRRSRSSRRSNRQS